MVLAIEKVLIQWTSSILTWSNIEPHAYKMKSDSLKKWRTLVYLSNMILREPSYTALTRISSTFWMVIFYRWSFWARSSQTRHVPVGRKKKAWAQRIWERYYTFWIFWNSVSIKASWQGRNWMKIWATIVEGVVTNFLVWKWSKNRKSFFSCQPVASSICLWTPSNI